MFHDLPLLGFITNIRGTQLIIILLVILLLFGGKRLPGMARSFGKAIREFKKSISGVEDEFRNAMDDPKTPNSKEKKASSKKKAKKKAA